MSKTTEKRRLEFIEENVYDELDKEMKDELLSYRRLYNRIVKKEGMVDNLQKKIKVEKDKLMDMRIELTEKNGVVDTLRKEYSFSISLIDQKPRGKNRIVYYNLCINRHDKKTIGMGTEKSIKELLGNHYKNNTSKMILLKKDWKQFIINETNYREINGRKIYGETYLRISKMIVKHGTNFEKIQVDRYTLFPT